MGILGIHLATRKECVQSIPSVKWEGVRMTPKNGGSALPAFLVAAVV